MSSRRAVAGLLLLVGLATPAAAQDSRPLHVALVGYLAAEGADLSTTMYVIGARRGTEANPFFAPFVKRPALAGAAKMSLAAGTSWLLLRTHEKHPRLALIAALAGAAFYSGVAYHNAKLIDGARR